MNNEHGNIKITDEVLAVCAAKAALQTQGVCGLAPAVFTDTISESFLGKASASKGAKISQNDDEIIIDLYVVVNYGVRIPSVAWNIQENVKNEIENLSGMKVSYVNIHVQGIHFGNKAKQGKQQDSEEKHEKK
ncbi:MAG: Asp23/Gls24 family envelope stress response protein [Anaerovoracaceae bacterium]